MTDFDKKLIEKASCFHCRDYEKIDVLIGIAETEEGRRELEALRWCCYDLTHETV